MPTVIVSGVELYYERAGSGPPLLFISGTGGDLRNQPNVFAGPLPRHFDVLAYDQRGLGRSAVPPGPYTMADYADDAAGLMAALDWDRAAVVGVSFGGMVAQELTLRHPDRVGRLVLACTSSGGAGGASYPLHELSDLSPEARAERSLALADTRLNEQWRAANPSRWAELLLGAQSQSRSAGATEPERLEGARLQLQARRGHDTWARLGQVSCPTLVCGGRFDGIAPRENVERLASAIPGSELVFFEGGHLFLVQDRAAFPAIIEFLQRG
ncbi:MAG: alpha/beta fold hydrolase [Acidimicrobiales bacterium]